ncbi:MAG TPA: DUF2085 domain-containing protein [Pyrinomonadaceae bacterium]|nr:DUF2085 domain-containing protein [Pyrinomonadaceae bacterium]
MIASPNSGETLTTRESRISVVVWGLLASIVLLIDIATVAAPAALSRGHLGFSEFIYQAFSYLCHQIPERSFHLAGHPFAVCSRCTGLYAGFAIATLALPLTRSLKRTDTPHVIWLLMSGVPLAVDFGLTYFEIWQNNHFTRVTTGALFGAVAALYVVPGLIELSVIVQRRFSRGSKKEDFGASL